MISVSYASTLPAGVEDERDETGVDPRVSGLGVS